MPRHDDPSRHAGSPRYTRTVGDQEVELLEPRPLREVLASRSVQVKAEDRLDLLAWRHLDRPFDFWRLVEANPAAVPEDLLEPGRHLLIPEEE